MKFQKIQKTKSFRKNRKHRFLFLIKHLKLLLEQYYQNGRNETLSVGIISPYKEQVKNLTIAIESDEELKKYPIRLAIKTIDGFQGQERDIIYISLVRSNDNKEIGFLSDIRRMNVALTRAKKKLVVIGDSATLSNHPFYKDFLEDFNLNVLGATECLKKYFTNLSQTKNARIRNHARQIKSSGKTNSNCSC